MPRRYAKLRAAMVEADIDRQFLAEELGISYQTVKNRFAGSWPWTLAEAYKTLEILHIDPSKLTEYFPPNGGIAS